VAVKVITDSTSYLSHAVRQTLDIAVVSLSSLLDGVVYDDGAEDYASFYRALEETRSFPLTSQPTVQDMVRAIEAPVSEGHNVVGVFISERMSGTYSTSLLARDMVLERYPDARIHLIDGMSNCMELGYAVLAAARAAAEGHSPESVIAAARDMIDRTRFLFVPQTLDYLRRGGRIGGASALIGTILKVHPILTVRDGMSDVFHRARTQQKALGLILEALTADAAAHGGVSDAVVHHIHSGAVGEAFASAVSEIVGRGVDLRPIGPVIGAHVGPGAIGVVYSTADPIHKNT